MDNKIAEIVNQEVIDSTKKYGEFNSSHEGYAVLLEEIEELSTEHSSMIYWKQRLWESIKANDGKHIEEAINNLKILSTKLLHEGVQAAAMVIKFDQLMRRGKNE